MQRLLRCLWIMGACLVLTTGTAFSALAEETGIKSVSINVRSEVYAGGGEDISITVRNDRYTVDGYELLTDQTDWEVGDTPKIMVTLRAADGYYFDRVTSRSKVNVNGATFVSANITDGKKTLEIKIKLKPAEGTLDPPGTPAWDQLDDGDRYGRGSGVFGRGSWDKSEGAGSYEVRLFRDEREVFSATDIVGGSFLFAPYLEKSGSYRFQVRALPRVGQEDYMEKSEWAESETMDISEDTIYNGPTAVERPYLSPGWQNTDKGWWYLRDDGTYPTDEWQLIDGKWYLFNQAGYMLTGWQERGGKRYFLDKTSGAMLTDTQVGNYYVGGDGAALSPGWQQKNGRWWYLRVNGTYPVSCWETVTGRKYLFDGSGYMLTGWQQYNGEWYYLESDGSLVTDNYVDGYYVNERGVWVP